jgi:alpha-tubulin suppressor-like RCC1 family protein
MNRAALMLRLLIAAALATALFAASGSHANSGSGSSTSASAISAGLGHSCALTSAGGVKCWGSNGHGELGDGGRSNRRTPVDVSGLRRGVAAIANGVRHGCALMRSGGVKCWGINSNGTLGDGTTSRRFAPVQVSGLTGVAAIAPGGDHSCALTNAGAVKCWGFNRSGALGDGTTSDRSRPVDVTGLSSGVKSIAAGFGHSCALTTAGGVKCWGSNLRGQLGDGTTSERLTPVHVSGLSSGVIAIAAGVAYSCALTNAGAVKCWGYNEYGQLGDGTTSQRSTPVDVSGLGGGVAAIATGGGHSCAIMRARSVKCWGLNSSGELGDGSAVNRSTPVDVSGLTGVTMIASGGFHSCALSRAGGAKCWGLNSFGQLGDGTSRNRRMPVGVIGFGAARATLAIVSRSVTVTPARVAAVQLRCGSQGRCRGAVTLSSARRPRLKLGSRTFSIAAGRTQAAKVSLTARGFRLLVRMRQLPARVRVGFGAGTAATRTITLRAPSAS